MILTSGSTKVTLAGMKTTTAIKRNVSLDAETFRIVARLAKRKRLTFSAALRRLIRLGATV